MVVVSENAKRLQKIDERFDRQGAMSAAMLNMATSTSGLQGSAQTILFSCFHNRQK